MNSAARNSKRASMRERNASVDILIQLLNAYLIERGEIPISSNTTILPYLTEDYEKLISLGLPPSLCVYPDASPEDSLATYEQELLLSKRLEARITILCRDETLMKDAHAKLDSENQQMAAKYKIPEFEKITRLPQKLAMLRVKQQLALDDCNKDFESRVAVHIATDGSLEAMESVWTLPEATWSEYIWALEATMKRGRPSPKTLEGCDFKHGKWMYQVYKGKQGENLNIQILQEENYGHMKKAMVAGKLGILVWHERVWDASKEARIKGHKPRNGIDLEWLIGDREDDDEEEGWQHLSEWVLETADADLGGEE